MRAIADDLVHEPLGNSHVLTSAGDTALPQNQDRVLVQFRGAARQYVVSMRGRIEAPATPPVASTFPFGLFTVTWGLDGTTFTTTVDGQSDQFLAVYGNEVTVTAGWDSENFAAGVAALPGILRFPQRVTLSASVAPSNSVTEAFRSLIVPQPVPRVPIPYAARAFILRSSSAADIAAVTTVGQLLSTGTLLDVYPGASVAAAHDDGRYMAICSLADTLAVTSAAPFVQPMIVEFLLSP